MFRVRPRFRFHGDKPKAESLYMQAWQFFNNIKIVGQGLQQKGPFKRKFQDGTQFVVQEIFGQPIIDILVPIKSEKPKGSVKLSIYCFDIIRTDGVNISPYLWDAVREPFGGAYLDECDENFPVFRIPTYDDHKWWLIAPTFKLESYGKFRFFYDGCVVDVDNTDEENIYKFMKKCVGWDRLLGYSETEQTWYFFIDKDYEPDPDKPNVLSLKDLHYINALDTVFAPEGGTENDRWYSDVTFTGEEDNPSLDPWDQELKHSPKYTVYVPVWQGDIASVSVHNMDSDNWPKFDNYLTVTCTMSEDFARHVDYRFNYKFGEHWEKIRVNSYWKYYEECHHGDGEIWSEGEHDVNLAPPFSVNIADEVGTRKMLSFDPLETFIGDETFLIEANKTIENWVITITAEDCNPTGCTYYHDYDEGYDVITFTECVYSCIGAHASPTPAEEGLCGEPFWGATVYTNVTANQIFKDLNLWGPIEGSKIYKAV